MENKPFPSGKGSQISSNRVPNQPLLCEGLGEIHVCFSFLVGEVVVGAHVRSTEF